jgi:signal transduction histidine kinase
LALRFPASLRSRLLLLIAVAVAPAIALTLVEVQEDRAAALEHAREDARRAAHLGAVAERRTIEGTRQLLASLAPLADLRHTDPALCHGVLAQSRQAAAPAYEGIAFVERDGRILCSSRASYPEGFRVENSTSLERALATKAFAVGDHRIHRVTGRPIMGATLPLLGPDGEVQAFLGATIDLEWLAAQVAAAESEPGLVVTLLDRHGTILARHPDHAGWVGRQVAPERLPRGGSADEVVVAEGVDGIRRVYAAVPVDPSDPGGLLVSVGTPLDAVVRPVEAAFARSLALILGVALLAGAGAWWVSEKALRRPLERLGAAAKRLEEGDFAARSGLAHDPSEMGALARRFDAMAAALEQSPARERALREEAEAAKARLEEVDRFRTQFVSVAAHELGNPLTPIALQLHILRSGLAGNPTPEQHKALAMLGRNVDRLSSLVRDLLDAARLQAGRLPLAPVPLDLARAAREAAEAWQEPGRQAKVAVEVRSAGPLVVRADPRRVAQVLDNLLGNALKFTPAGGRVLVEARADGGEARVEVRDSGAGFPPADADRLFAPFERLGRGAAQDGGGTGLGLYVSRGIVEQHGGRIWASSEGPGRGAAVGFTLPLAPRLEAPPPPAMERGLVP